MAASVTLRQRLQQCPRLLEVRRVKALGEPAVDGRQEVRGRRPLPLLLPQARQAHRHPQLPGLRLLATGYDEGLLETGLRLMGVLVWGHQEQLPLESIQ